jgi:hypothetical protein
MQIRPEGYFNIDQGQSIEGEIILPRGRDKRKFEKICRTMGNK